MGKVKYATGIEYVSGSLSKPTVKNGHEHGSYLIGTHRTAESTNPTCTRLYVRTADVYKRTTSLSANERNARARFTAVAQAVKNRRKNLATISADQQAYAAQKNNPDGIKTFKAYLWSLEGETYDAEHPQG